MGSSFRNLYIRISGFLFLALLCSPQGASALTEAGTRITNVATARYTDHIGASRTSESLPVVLTVAQVADFTLTSDACRVVSPAGTAYFPHTLTNTGNGPDTFSLAVANVAGGDYTFSSLVIFSDALNGDGIPDNGVPISSTGVLQIGGQYPFIVAVSVPATAQNGQTAEARVSAASGLDGGVTATNTDCVTVTANAIVTATKALEGVRSGLSPSGPYTYTLSYTNTSNATATNVKFTDSLPPGMTYFPNSGTWSALGVLNDAQGGLEGTAPNTIDYSVSGNIVTAILTEISPNRSGAISFQVTVDAGLLSPRQMDNKVSFEYDDSATTHAGPFNTNIVSFSVLQVPGVTLAAPPAPAPSIFQGQTVTFENVVTNTGNGTDTFDITIVSNTFPSNTSFRLYASGGVIPLLTTDKDSIPDTGPLQPGQSYTVVLVAILPPGVTGGPFSVSKMATSSVDETVSATTTDTLEGIIGNAVDVTDVCAISSTEQEATGQGPGPEGAPVAINYTDPGATTTFSLFIENTSPVGAPADSYNVTCSASPTQFSPPVPLPTGWTVIIKNTLDTIVTGTGLIQQADFEELLVEVTVPPDYPPGPVELYCQVLSPSTGAADVRHDEVIVNTVRYLAMTPNNTGQVFPGNSIVYKHTITNNGNIAEPNITLAVVNNKSGWRSVVFEDANGNGILDVSGPTPDPLAASPFSLAVNKSKTLLVQVFSPQTAGLGVADVSTLTATPLSLIDGEKQYPLVVTDNTVVMAGSLGVSKEQGLDSNCDGVAEGAFGAADLGTGSIPGACILYKITATNMGTENVINVLLNDATPPYTVYYSSTPMPPAASTVGSVSLVPSPSQNGKIIANVGILTPGQSAVLTFGVQIVAGTPAGAVSVDNQTSATYNDFTFEDRTVTSNTVILVVAQAAGVMLTADTTRTSMAGAVVYFAHTLTNTGNGTDTISLVNANVSGDGYDFSALAVYPDANGDGLPDVYTLITNTGLLNAGGIFRFVTVGTVSGLATPTQIGEMRITATSLFKGSVTTFNTDRVVLTDKAILEVYKSITSISGPSPSGRYTYTLGYFNKSAFPSTQVTLIDVIPVGMTYMANSARWSVTGLLATDPPLTDADKTDAQGGAVMILYDFGVTTPGTITAVINEIGGGQSGTITFEVTVNAGLSPQTLNNVVQYTYNDGGGVIGPFTSNTVGFTVGQFPGMTILGETVSGAPQGSTVSFQNVVTNTGNGTDTFDILVGVYDDHGNLIFPPLPENPFPAGTTFQLYQSDGITPLSDTNSNTTRDTGPLLSGASYTVVLQATLPPSAVGGPFGVVKVARSVLTQMTVGARDILTAITLNTVDLTNNDPLSTVPAPPGAGTGPEENAVITNVVAPGAATTFKLFVNNTSPAGTLPETYILEASTNSAFSVLTLPPGVTVVFKNSAGLAVTQVGPLSPGASGAVNAEVSVSATTPFETNDIYFRAIAVVSGASDRKHDALFVEAVRALILTPNHTGQIYPDNFVVYTHTLTNNGNAPETDIVLSVVNDLSGWVSEIYEDIDPDGSGPLLPNGILDAGDVQVASIALLDSTTSKTLLVKVIAPPETTATQGMVDVSTLTATPTPILRGISHGPVSVTDTSTVIISRIVLTKLQALDANCDGAPDAGVYAADPITLGIVPGVCIRYQIRAESTGNVNALNVLINETTPPNTFYHDTVPVAVSIGSITTVPNSGQAGNVVATIGAMAPGAMAEMTLGVVVAPTALVNSNIDNTANATHTDTSGLARTVIPSTVRAQVAQVVGLLLVADGALNVSPGGTVYFPHTLTNTGNGMDSFALAAVNVAGDDFDFDAIFIYVDVDGNGIPDNTVDTNGDTIPDSPAPITNTGNLTAGALFKFVVAATAPLGALSTDFADLTVTASSMLQTSETASNTDRATLVRAVVNFSKTINALTALSGLSPSGSYVYALDYVNTGNGPAATVTLTDVIPTGMLYVGDSGLWSVTGVTVLTDAVDGVQGTVPETIDYVVSGNTVTAILKQVPAGASGRVRFSVNVDSGLAALQLGNTAAYAYDDSPTSHVAAVNTNTVVFTVLQVAGVALGGDTQADAPQGGTVTFENILTNTGNGTDTFDITLGANSFPVGTVVKLYHPDGVTVLTDTGPILAGASHTIILKAILPTGVTSGSFSISKTATSVFDATVSATADDALNAIIPKIPDVTFTGETEASVSQGGTVTFENILTNTGNATDTFDITLGANSFPVGTVVKLYHPDGVTVLTDTGEVLAGASHTVVLKATLPAGAVGGPFTVSKTATSGFDATVSATANDALTEISVRSLALTKSGSQQVVAGGSVVYTHVITNNGNVTESSIEFSTSDNQTNWTSDVYEDSDGNGLFDDRVDTLLGTLTLVEGASQTLFVKVTTASTAAPSTQNQTTLSAIPEATNVSGVLGATTVVDSTSVTASDLTVNKLQALDATCNGVPDTFFSTADLSGVLPGTSCVRYQITVTNVGTAVAANVLVRDATPDYTTYHSVVPAATTLGTLTPPPGGTRGGVIDVVVGTLVQNQSVTMTFGVQIQAGTLANTVIVNDADVTFVDASGVNQAIQSGSVAASVAQIFGLSLTEGALQFANPEQTVFFPHTLTNLGNGTDTFSLVNTNYLDLNDPDDFDFANLVIYLDANGDGLPDNTTPITSTGPLVAGATFTFIASAQVPIGAPDDGLGDMAVTATSQGNAAVTGQNVDNVTVTVDAVVNITKTINVASGLSPSGPYTYTLTYSNFSNATAVTLTDTIPVGMTYVPGSGRWSVTGATALTDAANDAQGTMPDTINYQFSSNTVTATINQIEQGESGTVTFQVTVNSGLSLSVIQNEVFGSGAGLVPFKDVADFTVIASPTVSKAFGAENIVSGGHTSLTLTIGNTNTTTLTTSGIFTDTLPTGMVIGANGPSGSCLSSSVTAVLGDNKVTMASGTAIPSGGCTIVVDVTATESGDYTNTLAVGALATTTAGSNRVAASDTLTVFARPTVEKTFSPKTILPGGVSTLTMTLGNPNATSITTNGTFSDTLPNGMTLASAPKTTGIPCLGVTGTLGAGSISMASGTVIPSGGCTIVVDVTATIAADYTNTIAAGVLNTATAGSNALAATDTLTVSTLLPPTVSKVFGAESIISGGQTTLTITLGNGNILPLTTSGSLTDTLQTSMIITSGNSGTCTGVTVGTNAVTIPSGMTIPAGGCTIVVDVTATLEGNYVNTIPEGALSTTTAGSNPNDATDTLTVVVSAVPLTITKSFSPIAVAIGAPSTMTITISNPNAVSVTGVAVSDLYPTGGQPISGFVTGMVNDVSVSTAATNSCGGTFVATALDDNIELSNGIIPAGGQCVIAVPVIACPVGHYINSASVTSSAGGTASAVDTLQVSCPIGHTYTGQTGPGDLNCDGIVSVEDLTVVTSKFGRTRLDTGWDPAADPNCDGLVNVDDLTVVTSTFGRMYGP